MILSSDINLMDLPNFLLNNSSLHQIVTKPTRGNRILDVIITNIPQVYFEPNIVPAIGPDINGQGVPSVHKGVVVFPKGSHENDKSK